MKQPGEFDTFTLLVDRVLSVPHDVIQKRIEEQRKRSAAKQVRPGPKPKRKVTPPASGHGEPS